ncbi:MAG: hypothetical protein FWG87_08070, partial [Defluviitaleaceae bacterium]|nr:hypothetical protein [Defluviitaleaceae bacterium]
MVRTTRINEQPRPTKCYRCEDGTDFYTKIESNSTQKTENGKIELSKHVYVCTSCNAVYGSAYLQHEETLHEEMEKNGGGGGGGLSPFFWKKKKRLGGRGLKGRGGGLKAF